MKNKERAIKYIEECRDIHQDWIECQDAGELTKEELEIGGGKTWHKKWVRQYNFVLKELQKV